MFIGKEAQGLPTHTHTPPASPHTRKHRTDRDGIPVYPAETFTAPEKLEANMTVGIGEKDRRVKPSRKLKSALTPTRSVKMIL